MKKCFMIVLVILVLITGCSVPPASPTAAPTVEPQPTTQPVESARTLLGFDDLVNSFEAASPVDESALTPPAGAASPAYTFEGRLELSNQDANGKIEMIQGEVDPVFASLPEFDFEFVQSDGYLIPVQRGVITTEHPVWNIILEPGRVWQEAADNGYSRASLPFTLVVKTGNSSFNGTLTFLFTGDQVSKVWYQVTQETSSYTRLNLWGLLDAAYHPETVKNADQVREDFAAELAARMPVKPIETLAQDYPGVEISAIGKGVTPAHMTYYGVVVDGVNYLGGCQTRFGVYPYCESMRAASFSTAKSAFAGTALMRLAQKYSPDITGLLIKDYVPGSAESAGNWETVTFNNTIDMATGNYYSADFMADDEGEKMGEFFGAQTYLDHIKIAYAAPNQAEPGTTWVYRTSDTFLLTSALQSYLRLKEGENADIFQFVVDEVYQPLGLGPGAFSTIRTTESDGQGQAEGGYGLWWIADDIAKIGTFLIVDGGEINGQPVLHPGLLAASLQQDPDDRGVQIDSRRMYNNAFWANHYTETSGYGCDFWVPQMLGVSGNVVALFPNGITYYYFSDNREFTFDAALRASDKIKPLCP